MADTGTQILIGVGGTLFGGGALAVLASTLNWWRQAPKDEERIARLEDWQKSYSVENKESSKELAERIFDQIDIGRESQRDIERDMRSLVTNLQRTVDELRTMAIEQNAAIKSTSVVLNGLLNRQEAQSTILNTHESTIQYHAQVIRRIESKGGGD